MKYLTCIIAALWFWAPCVSLQAQNLKSFLSGGVTSAPDYTVNTAVFDGTNDYIRTEATGDTGWADGTTFTIAGWIKPASTAATNYIYSGATSSAALKVGAYIDTSAKLQFRGDSTSGTDGVDFAFNLTSDATISTGVWTHFHLCVNTASSSDTKLYVNGVEDTSLVETALTGTIDMAYTGDRFTVGANSSGTAANFFNGSMAELWINDSLVTDNSKFYSGGGPVDLGTNGEIPTGASPCHYFSSNGSGSSWLNMGTAGGTAPSFTVNGGGLGTDTSP